MTKRGNKKPLRGRSPTQSLRIKKVKKKPSKKKIARKKAPAKAMKNFETKKNLVVRKLILFIILFVASLLIYSVSNQEVYTNLFFILSVLLGFLALAFLLVYLIFFFRKVMK